MNVKAPVKVDEWNLITIGNGIQIIKNGRKIAYCVSFDKAWNWVQNQATAGDKINISVQGILS